MSVPAGQRDRKVSFFQASIARDALGTEQETFEFVFEDWASVKFGTGAERRDAAAANAVQSANFRIRSSAAARAVNRRDRVHFDGAVWGIEGIATVGAQGHEIEFTAKMVEIELER